MGVPEGFEGLRFPCECVSSRAGGYSEPWAAVAKNRLMPRMFRKARQISDNDRLGRLIIWFALSSPVRLSTQRFPCLFF